MLRESCDKIGDLPYDANGRNDDYGHGRINAEAAVLAALAAAGTVVAGAGTPSTTCTGSRSAPRPSRSCAPFAGTDLDLGCRPAVRRGDGELVVEAYATMPQIDGLRAARRARRRDGRCARERHRGRPLPAGRGRPWNRFAARQAPRGLGIKE